MTSLSDHFPSPERPALEIIGERAYALHQDGVLAVFDSPRPEPEDEPILTLDLRHSLSPVPIEGNRLGNWTKALQMVPPSERKYPEHN